MKMKRHTVRTTVKIRMNPSAPWWVFHASAKFLYVVGVIGVVLAPIALLQTRYGDALSHFLFGWLAVSLGWFWGLVDRRERRVFDLDLKAEVDS